MTYTIILEVESIDLQTLETEVHGFSDRAFTSPSGVQYLPILDTKTLPSVTTSIFKGGRTGGVSTGDSARLRLVRKVQGRDRLAFLEGREIAGRSARLIAVGDLPGGTRTYKDPYVIADGVIGPVPLLRPDRLDLEIRRRSHALDAEVPERKYTGLGEGLLFDGVDDQVDTPLVFQPADGTIFGWVFVPRRYVGSTEQVIASNDSLAVMLSDYSTRRLEIRHQTSPGVYAVVNGPEIPELERLYFWAVRWTAAGEMAIWLEADRVDAQGVVIHDAGSAWTFGATPSGALRFNGMAGGWTFVSSAITDTKIEEFRVAAPLGNEENLVAYYGGESDSGTLFDLAGVNNPPIDATIIGGAAAINLLEGGEALRGNVKPRVFGWAENVLGTAVDPTRLIYQWCGEPVMRFLAVYDRQAPFEIEAVHESLVDFYQVAPTADGKCTTYPKLGLVRFYSLPDGAVLTADILGESCWRRSRVLEPDGWMTWGTALNGLFSTSFMWEFGFCIPVEVSPQTLFRADTWSLVYEDLFLEFERVGYALHLSTAINGAGGLEPVSLWARVEAGASHYGSIVFDESGGQVKVSLYLDGQLQSSATVTGSILAASGDFVAGRGSFFPWQEAQGVHLSEIRLWSSARTEEQVRSTLFETGDLPGVAGLWRGRDYAGNTLHDEIAGRNAQAQGAAGRWAPGVYAGTPVAMACLMLDSLGGVDLPSLDLQDAWGLDTSPHSQVLQGKTTLRKALSEVLDGLNGYAYPTALGTIALGQLLAPATAPLAGVITSDQIASIELQETQRPSVVWEVGCRRVWHTQEGDAVAQGADPERVALVSKPRRYTEACEPDNAKRYPSATPRQTTEANYRFAIGAKVEADRQKALRGVRRGLWKVVLKKGLALYRPGHVYQVHHPDLPGGTQRLVVLELIDNIRTAQLKLWG